MSSKSNPLKRALWCLYQAFVWLELLVHERVMRAVRRVRTPLSELALKRFLTCDHRTRNKVIADFGMPLFEGMHPKNIFNFRYQFFLENVGPQDVVLDVACGSGLLLSKIAPAIQAGFGVELSKQQLELCRTHHAQKNLSFIEGDIFKFDYASLSAASDMSGTGHARSVSIALFSHILEHIEDVPSLLRKVAAPTVLICVPSQENWLTQLKIHYGLPYLTDATHFREYTREMLAKELTAAGYRTSFMGFNSEGEIICRAERE